MQAESFTSAETNVIGAGSPRSREEHGGKLRGELANANVRAQKARYSLVMSLRSGDSDIDLYTPIASMIRAETEVEEIAIRP